MRDFADLGFAKPDLDRQQRQSVGEVIFGEGKSAHQIVSIAYALMNGGQKRVLITRMDEEKALNVARLWTHNDQSEPLRWFAPWDHGTSDQEKDQKVEVADDDPLSPLRSPLYYDRGGHIGYIGQKPTIDGVGRIGVVTAGTSDLPVALEAAFTASFLGNQVFFLVDVGVAGIHRLLAYRDTLEQCRVIVAVAGMEGALASVVGGLISSPVIAVPTSVGYGASFGGLSALLTMLNSCASGVSVVNIDNGFGAAYQASLINHLPKVS